MKSISIRNILVPIDFSEMSIQTIGTAKQLAQRFDATIHLGHVHAFTYPAEFMGPIFSAGERPESFEEHRGKQLAEQLKTVAKQAGLSSGDPAHVKSGAPPFKEICKLAEEIPADLIVTPTHGHTGLKHIFLGSTAERIVQHSPCPVLVARQDKRIAKGAGPFSINTILVPVDFSDCSLEGLNYAIAFAEKFAAKVILLHAVYLGSVYASEGYGTYDFSSFTEIVRKAAEEQMRDFVRGPKFGRIKFETVITTGAPVEEITAFARAQGVDLIITSTHGLTGLKHVLLGSTAEQVVRHAACPVLVVPSHPKTRMALLNRPRHQKAQTRRR